MSIRGLQKDVKCHHQVVTNVLVSTIIISYAALPDGKNPLTLKPQLCALYFFLFAVLSTSLSAFNINQQIHPFPRE